MAIGGNGFKLNIFTLILSIAFSCTSQKTAEHTSQSAATAPAKMNEKENRPVKTIPMSGPVVTNNNQVAPGNCRLVAEVVDINPQLEPDKTQPCGKVPCKAMVKVRKVIAYGAAFKPPLAEGQEIPVYFSFTLSPTAAFFPELATPLPGLSVGSIIQADVKNPGEGSASSPAWYQVYTYSVK